MPVSPIIITTDVGRLENFYRSLFDAPVVDRVPDEGPVFYLGLDVGGSTLGLVADEDAPAAPGPVLLSVDVADVDALLPRVEGLGGRVQGPANDMAWGQRVGHVHDPDGNAVNLTQKI